MTATYPLPVGFVLSLAPFLLPMYRFKLVLLSNFI